MIDIKKVQEEAEKEVHDEKVQKAKEKIKALLLKRDQAKQVLANIEREITDAYASIGEGTLI